jgi:hypothetical protein
VAHDGLDERLVEGGEQDVEAVLVEHRERRILHQAAAENGERTPFAERLLGGGGLGDRVRAERIDARCRAGIARAAGGVRGRHGGGREALTAGGTEESAGGAVRSALRTTEKRSAALRAVAALDGVRLTATRALQRDRSPGCARRRRSSYTTTAGVRRSATLPRPATLPPRHTSGKRRSAAVGSVSGMAVMKEALRAATLTFYFDAYGVTEIAEAPARPGTACFPASTGCRGSFSRAR